jgi:uroporphyrinogen-III synthase
MAERGIVLWVRVRSPDQENKAQQILHQHGGQAIRVHEIDIEKHPEEIPLSSLRPDPWLGNERLGRP